MTEETKEPKETKKESTEQKDLQTEAQELLAQLKTLGVEKPEQLQNMAHASKQVGKAWNEVGDLKRQLDHMQQLLEAEKANRRTTDDYSGGEQIDLGKTIRNEVMSVFEEIQRKNLEAQSRYYQELSAIQSDPDFNVVQSAWERHIQNPSVNQSIQMGQTTFEKEYNKLVRTFYRELAGRSKNFVEKWADKVKPAPPHVEQGSTENVYTPTSDDDRAEKKKKVIEDRRKGFLSGDESLRELVKDSLPPADDPFWNI